MKPGKRKWLLAVIAGALLLLFIPLMVYAAALRQGDSGEEVKAVQKKLRQWGYYEGEVDGIFGSGTKKAVIKFQQKNGLTADGIVGEKTAEALGLQLSSSSGGSSSGGSDSNIYLLAQCINGEARGESYKGQVAVGAVILNRVKSSKFPNTIAGVIYQQGAFDAVSDGQINQTPSDSCLKAARDAMNGYDPTGGCLYYYNPATTTNKWMLSKPVSLRIGNHVFCR